MFNNEFSQWGKYICSLLLHIHAIFKRMITRGHVGHNVFWAPHIHKSSPRILTCSLLKRLHTYVRYVYLAHTFPVTLAHRLPLAVTVDLFSWLFLDPFSKPWMEFRFRFRFRKTLLSAVTENLLSSRLTYETRPIQDSVSTLCVGSLRKY